MNTLGIYYIYKTGGLPVGPFYVWEVLDLYDRGEISDNDKITVGDKPNFPKAILVMDSQALKSFPELRRLSKAPLQLAVNQLGEQFREELVKIRRATESTASVAKVFFFIFILSLILGFFLSAGRGH
jgi:hypothetical protein